MFTTMISLLPFKPVPAIDSLRREQSFDSTSSIGMFDMEINVSFVNSEHPGESGSGSKNMLIVNFLV